MMKILRPSAAIRSYGSNLIYRLGSAMQPLSYLIYRSSSFPPGYQHDIILEPCYPIGFDSVSVGEFLIVEQNKKRIFFVVCASEHHVFYPQTPHNTELVREILEPPDKNCNYSLIS